MKPKSWREQEKLTLQAAAEKLGISAAYLSMIETGQRQPSFDLLKVFDRVSDGQVTQRDFYQ